MRKVAASLDDMYTSKVQRFRDIFEFWIGQKFNHFGGFRNFQMNKKEEVALARACLRYFR